MNYEKERSGGLERESYLNVIMLSNLCNLSRFKETEVLSLLGDRNI
jgi:hypothetical protein